MKWKFNSLGVWAKVEDDALWKHYSSYERVAFDMPRDEQGLYLVGTRQGSGMKQINKYANEWIKSCPRDCNKYAIEFEFAFPKNNFQELCEILNNYRSENFPNGLCYKNLIWITEDCSINARRPNEYPLEIKTMPLDFVRQRELCAVLGKTVKELGGRFGKEAGAGIHIHVDRDKNDEIKTVRLIDTMTKDIQNWEIKFGRGKVYTNKVGKWRFRSTWASGGDKYRKSWVKKYRDASFEGEYWQIMKWKYMTQVMENGEVKQTVKIMPPGKIGFEYGFNHTAVINLEHSHTVEVRGFSSTPDIEKCIDVIGDYVAKANGSKYAFGVESHEQLAKEVDERVKNELADKRSQMQLVLVGDKPKEEKKDNETNNGRNNRGDR